MGPWWIGIARAQEADPEPDPTEPIVIAPVDEEVPTAVDGVGQMRAETRLDPTDPDWIPLPGNLLRGKWFVRPVLGVGLHSGGAAAWMGGAVGHTWWTLGELPIQGGGESVLRASVPVGAAEGYRFDLGTSLGPWLGPVGIRVGPLLRVDRERWGTAELATAPSLGGTVDLTLDAGPIGLLAGIQPLWDLSGDRGPASSEGLLPAIGTDTAWRAGLIASVPYLDLSAEVVDRVTPIGSVIELNLGLRIRLFAGGE